MKSLFTPLLCILFLLATLWAGSCSKQYQCICVGSGPIQIDSYIINASNSRAATEFCESKSTTDVAGGLTCKLQ